MGRAGVYQQVDHSRVESESVEPPACQIGFGTCSAVGKVLSRPDGDMTISPSGRERPLRSLSDTTSTIQVVAIKKFAPPSLSWNRPGTRLALGPLAQAARAA